MKKRNIIVCTFVMLFCGIVLVKVDAASRAIGGGVNLSKGDDISYVMEDATYDYFFGSAIANTNPTNGTYLTRKMRKNSWLSYSDIAKDHILGLNTSNYAHTSIYVYAIDDNYKHTFIAEGGAFSGSVQTTNSTTNYIGF